MISTFFGILLALLVMHLWNTLMNSPEMINASILDKISAVGSILFLAGAAYSLIITFTIG